jgi:hypothetical protein
MNGAGGWVIEGGLNEQERRGRYLAEALAHCGECHTPRNLPAGCDISRWFAGAPNPVGRRAHPEHHARRAGLVGRRPDDLFHPRLHARIRHRRRHHGRGGQEPRDGCRKRTAKRSSPICGSGAPGGVTAGERAHSAPRIVPYPAPLRWGLAVMPAESCFCAFLQLRPTSVRFLGMHVVCTADARESYVDAHADLAVSAPSYTGSTSPCGPARPRCGSEPGQPTADGAAAYPP